MKSKSKQTKSTFTPHVSRQQTFRIKVAHSNQPSMSNKTNSKNQPYHTSLHSFKGISVDHGSFHCVQPKLKISDPNTKDEQEADRMAEMVMTMPETQTIQKQENEEEVNLKMIQRQVEEEEEEGEIKPKIIRRQVERGKDEEDLINPKLMRRQIAEEKDEEEEISPKIISRQMKEEEEDTISPKN